MKESEAFLSQSGPLEESTDDFGTLEQTEQVRASGFASDATEIVRTRKKKRSGQDRGAASSTSQSSPDMNTGVPSAAVARRTFGVQGRNQDNRRSAAKVASRKKTRPNIKIDARNLDSRPVSNRKLQNRIAIMAGAILCAIAIGLLIGRKRMSKQRAESSAITSSAPSLVRPVAKGFNGPSSSKTKPHTSIDCSKNCEFLVGSGGKVSFAR